ncbi:nucleoside-diphosphate kinase [Candidatus Gracilibacteria bacterium]|nr:nucleoside-diphosphate kinase [Candidatus Gracilibacteria bacterium]
MSQPSHPKKERTFVILKPDTIQRSLVGEILRRYENMGLKIVGMKMLQADEDTIWKHYNKDDAWFLKKGSGTVENRKKAGMPVEKEAIEYGKDIIRGAVKYIQASPVIALVLEGNQAVAIVKKLVGGTEPTTSDVGTIRGDYALDSYAMSDFDQSRCVRNLVHCTDKVEEADFEINLWFKKEEMFDYKHIQDIMLYDINFDGISE